ncbi:MAG: hypothetical protein AB1544_08745 [Pseudomonadota bacterium]
MRSTSRQLRRRVLGALAVLPLLNPRFCGAQQRRAPASSIPVWAPAAGRIVNISYPAGQHPLGRGATLAEISPAYQDWNPTKPSVVLYGNRWYGWHTYNGYCGCTFNTDTRQIVLYGAGHASINVCAPSCFDLNDRRWKWLDKPLPFDANALAIRSGYPHPLSEARYREFYPPEQVDYLWGEVKGDWPGWPNGYGRPGKVQPIPTHSRGTLIHIPGAVYGNGKGALLYHGKATGLFSDTLSVASHLYDFDTNTWLRTANHYPTDGMSFHGCIFDRQSGKMVAFGNGSTQSTTYRVFDVATRLWTTRRASVAVATSTDHPGNVLHEASRLHIVPAQRNALGQSAHRGIKYHFWATPLDAIVGSGPFAPVLLTVSEQGGWPLNNEGNNAFIGWSYCPLDRCLYAINGIAGSDRYWRLAPPHRAVVQNDFLNGTWTLTEHSFIDGKIASDGQVFNRLSWDEISLSFIWYGNAVTSVVQVFRPATLL